MTESALEKRLGDEIQLMRLVEDRLRPSIQIDQQAVETYYNDQLLPEMKTGRQSRHTVDRKSLAGSRICWPRKK